MVCRMQEWKEISDNESHKHFSDIIDFRYYGVLLPLSDKAG